RRHTRCLSDWSSDVCSSDLVVELDFTHAHNDYLELAAEFGIAGFALFSSLMVLTFARAYRAFTSGREWNVRLAGLGCAGAAVARSEERRVGEGWRPRWSEQV